MESEEKLVSFFDEVNSKIVFMTKNEVDNIVIPMYQDNWSVRDTVNHILSVRDFNKKLLAKGQMQ